ncbi:MAG: hypothetical protein ABJ205_15330 [Erythrobacter sp.]|uniref:hypothetical protein n=1 Tax=Erythrobacter sp. TaxID=1042 RepID=UPI003267DC02
MRALIDLVDSFTGIVRFIIVAIILVGLSLALMLTAGVSYVAPKVANGATERAAQIGELAIEEARNAQRDRDLAKDGWGYDSGNSRQDRSANSRNRDSDGGGWGDDSQ